MTCAQLFWTTMYNTKYFPIKKKQKNFFLKRFTWVIIECMRFFVDTFNALLRYQQLYKVFQRTAICLPNFALCHQYTVSITQCLCNFKESVFIAFLFNLCSSRFFSYANDIATIRQSTSVSAIYFRKSTNQINVLFAVP